MTSSPAIVEILKFLNPLKLLKPILIRPHVSLETKIPTPSRDYGGLIIHEMHQQGLDFSGQNHYLIYRVKVRNKPKKLGIIGDTARNCRLSLTGIEVQDPNTLAFTASQYHHDLPLRWFEEHHGLQRIDLFPGEEAFATVMAFYVNKPVFNFGFAVEKWPDTYRWMTDRTSYGMNKSITLRVRIKLSGENFHAIEGTFLFSFNSTLDFSIDGVRFDNTRITSLVA